MSQNQWIIGIDFGTSNTAAAHTNHIKGTVEAVNLSHNRTTMSSSVYVESPDDIAVGDVATDKAETNPAGFIPAPKRVIPQHMFQVNGYDISAARPVAAVLSSVVQRVAREHGNSQPSELVLTHPEAWSTNEINVLLEAASQLGLSAAKITTISEPQAAAHYYSRANALAPGQRIAVFDFGGGTLDIAVLQANESGTFDVVAARGDNSLGGKNFDALIRSWVDRQLEDRNPDLLHYFRVQAPLQERHALEDSIRRAKELLSETSYATIVASGNGETERFQLTRAEFEELITPALDKAVRLTQETFNDAQLTSPDDIVALYLTGGSSRIPIVQERLKTFGPLATLDDPKTVVAQGAISALGPIVRGMSPQTMGAHNIPPAQPTPPAPAPSTPGAQPAGGKASKSKLVIAAVTAAVLVAAGAAGVYFLSRDTSTEPTGGSGTAPSAASTSSSAAATTTSAETKPQTVAEITALAPAGLTDDFDNCVVDQTSNLGNVQVKCEIKEDSPALQYFISGRYAQTPTVTFFVNAHEADLEYRRITEGWYDRRDVKSETYESADKTAAGYVISSFTAGEFDVYYASKTSGLVLKSGDFKDPTLFKEYLESKGLI